MYNVCNYNRWCRGILIFLRKRNICHLYHWLKMHFLLSVVNENNWNDVILSPHKLRIVLRNNDVRCRRCFDSVTTAPMKRKSHKIFHWCRFCAAEHFFLKSLSNHRHNEMIHKYAYNHPGIISLWCTYICIL